MKRWFLALALLGASNMAALAQAYPNKTIRVVVPFSAGSGTDIVARTIMDQVSRQIGQPIIVENRVGAGGTIGIGSVAKADPDGYTLLIQSTSFAVVATTYSSPGYDSIKDFAPITALVSLPNVMIVQANKYKTLKDFVAAAKANPGKMNYASAGAGSAAHLNGERFAIATGTKYQHIPYKGGPEGVTSVMSGETDFYFIPLPAARGPVATGKLADPRGVGLATLGVAAGRADHGRGRFPELGIRFLGRLLGARRDAAGNRRQAQRRDAQGIGRSRREGEAQGHRRRPAADEPAQSSAPS